MKKRCWIIGILLGVTVACQTLPVEEEATREPTDPAPTATERVAPTLAATDVSAPLPTEPVHPTLTPRATTFAPSTVGSERLGLQLMVPGTWIDASDTVSEASKEAADSALFLLYADSEETVDALLTGADLGMGAVVVSYVEADQTVTDPVTALEERVRLSTGEHTDSVVPRVIQGADAAMVDLSREPLQLFPPGSTPRRWRILLVEQVETGAALYVLLGADAANFETYAGLFDEIIATVSLSMPRRSVPGFEAPVGIQGTLPNDQTVTGNLGVESVDVWRFEAEGGEYASIHLSPRQDNLDLAFTVVAPSGQTLRDADAGYAGSGERITDLRLLEAGEYVVVIREFFGVSGPYRLHLALSPEPLYSAGGSMAIGQVVTSQLPERRDQVWSFEAEAGQVISLILTPEEGSFDAILEVRDPAGSVLIELDEGFSSDAEVISGLTLPISGTYTVHVSGFGGEGGPYTLTLAEGGEETENLYDAGDLIFGSAEEETLQQNEAHAWFFQGLQGDKVEVLASPVDSNLDLHIWLLDTDVQRLAEQDAFYAGRSEKITHTLPENGEYIVLVREFTGRPGDYMLALTFNGNGHVVDLGPLFLDSAVSGNIAGSESVAWHFQGTSGQTLAFQATPLENEDLVLILRDPEGNIMVNRDEGRAGEAEEVSAYRLPTTGEWTVVLREAFGQPATYSLTITTAD